MSPNGNEKPLNIDGKLPQESETNANDSTSSSSSSSSSSRTSKNHHVSFPVDACSKNNSASGKRLKKSLSLFNSGSETSREKIVYNRPPDGGWGWIVVFASFMIQMIADGISLSFGVIFVDLLKTFGESKSKTAWVGSLFLSIPLLTGPIASTMTDHFGCRKTAIAGSIIAGIGFALGSLSTQIEHLFVAFSIAGFGIALCTVTSIVAVAYYFERRRSLATGLSVSGSGFGTFIFAPFTIYLFEKLEWRKTFLVLAGIFLTIVFFGMLIRDIDIDEFDSDDDDDDDDSDDSSSDDDSGSDIDSDELDSIPEADEEADIESAAHRNSSRRSSTDSGKMNRKSMFSRCSRARHVSECDKSHEALPRSCTSLINIPTYIKESSNTRIGKKNGVPGKNPNPDSKKDQSDNESKNTNPEQSTELTFRRGGYLHNLIRYYPHLLSLFLQPSTVEGNEDLTVRTVTNVNGTAGQSHDEAKLRVLETVFHNPENDYGDDDVYEDDRDDGVKDDHDLCEKHQLSITQDRKDAFIPSAVNESVSIIVPSSRPNKNDLLNYHKTRHRLNRLARNRHRHRMHQTHLHQDPAAGGNCLNNLRLQRGSLTYRSAMLVISKYKLKASSCPDIYRTSMATINQHKQNSFFGNIKEIFTDMIDFSSLKNVPFLIFCMSNFILYACIDIPYIYLPDQAISTGSFTKEGASFLISIIGIFNTGGILLTGYIGDKPYLDASMIYAIFTLVSGLSLTAMPLYTSRMFVSSLTAIYGFAISANYSLASVILVELISLDSFTQAYGLLLLLQGIASLLGPPVVGWIFDISGTYDLAFFLTGIFVILSGIMVIPIGKKQNCFLWKRKLSRTGSTSTLKFRPLSFLKQVKKSNNYKTANNNSKNST